MRQNIHSRGRADATGLTGTSKSSENNEGSNFNLANINLGINKNEFEDNINEPFSKTQNFSNGIIKDMILAESNPEVTSDHDNNSINERKESGHNVNDYGMVEIINEKHSNYLQDDEPASQTLIQNRNTKVQNENFEEENEIINEEAEEEYSIEANEEGIPLPVVESHKEVISNNSQSAELINEGEDHSEDEINQQTNIEDVHEHKIDHEHAHDSLENNIQDHYNEEHDVQSHSEKDLVEDDYNFEPHVEQNNNEKEHFQPATKEITNDLASDNVHIKKTNSNQIENKQLSDDNQNNHAMDGFAFELPDDSDD